MKGSTLLTQAREDLRARAAYAEGAGIYRMVPGSVAQPASADDVRGLLAWARAKKIPVTPRGAGSAMGGGNVGDGLILDLTCSRSCDGSASMSTPGSPMSRRVRPASAVNNAALPHRLRLPPDPSSLRFATSGGPGLHQCVGGQELSVRQRPPLGRRARHRDGRGYLLSLDRGKPAPACPRCSASSATWRRDFARPGPPSARDSPGPARTRAATRSTPGSTPMT